jgi:hypothetical protein
MLPPCAHMQEGESKVIRCRTRRDAGVRYVCVSVCVCEREAMVRARAREDEDEGVRVLKMDHH